MFNSHIYKAIFYLKGISRASPTQKCYRLSQLYPLISPLSLKYSTITSDQHPFTVSYLINNCGFSPETALNASKHLRFKTAQKPDSVLALFRNHGFSNTQIGNVVRKAPRLLSFDPNKILSPKLEFLASKGASGSDIVLAVTKCPKLLYSRLGNRIIPMYELVRRFCLSDKKTVDLIVKVPSFLVNGSLAQRNMKFLLDEGVMDSNIGLLLNRRPSVLLFSDLSKAANEVKELGFDPKNSTFVVALLAKMTVAKHLWDSKVDIFKSWGWSDEDILKAFRRQPHCMLASTDKINAFMNFWVNQLGWNSLHLVKQPGLFGFSLEKRIIPRASVVDYLLSKGLRNKSASLITPFMISEKLFLQKFVESFKEESCLLLKLYREKMNLQINRENGYMSNI